MTHRTHRSFTLLELIAVITIVALITGLVSQRIGHTPAFLTIEDFVAKIERLSQTAAKRSILQGKNLGVFFNTDDRKLFLGSSIGQQSNDRESSIELPEEVELAYDTENEEDPVFLFYPDGTGDGTPLRISFKAHERIIEISPLTGTLLAYEPE